MSVVGLIVNITFTLSLICHFVVALVDADTASFLTVKFEKLLYIYSLKMRSCIRVISHTFHQLPAIFINMSMLPTLEALSH